MAPRSHLLARGSSLLLALTLALSLTACGDDEHAIYGGGAAGGPGSEPESDTATAEETTPATSGSAGACAFGTWTLDNESWAAELEAIAAQGMSGLSVEVTGLLTLEWTAGEYVLTAEASRYELSGRAEGVNFTQSIEHHGTESGTWSAPGGDVLSLRGDGVSAFDTDLTITVDGRTLDQEAADVPVAPWTGDMVVLCTPTQMTTSVTEEGVTATVTWSRA